MSKIETLTEQIRVEKMYMGDYKSFEQMSYEETLGTIVEKNPKSFEAFFSLFTNEEEAFDVMVQAIIALNDRTNPMFVKSANKNSMSCTLDTAITTLLSLKINGVNMRAEKLQASCLIIETLNGVVFEIYEEYTGRGDVMVMLENRLSYPPVKESDIPIYRNSLMAMVTKPREWHEGDITGGYINYPFKHILNKGEQHQKENTMQHLNVLQSNSWRLSPHASHINPTTYWEKAMMKKGTNEYIAVKTAQQKYDFYRKAVAYYRDFDEIFLAWNRDFRGRTYSKGYMVNAQGDKITKGLLVPNNRQEITERGYEWLIINIANLFGDDKLLFHERVAKYDLPVEDLRAMADEADSPLEFMNAVDALEDYRKTGSCDSLVYLDASNQALQMYAVLTGDKETARICNLASGNTLEDAYKELAKLINTAVGFDYLQRNHTKKALMTAMYGKEDIVSEIINALYPELSWDEATERVATDIGSHTELVKNQLRCVKFDEICITSLSKLAPRAVQMMEAILASHNPEATVITWETPSGFKVQFNVKKKVPYEFSYTFANGYTFARTGVTEEYGASDTSRALAPNVIHSLDGWVAEEVTNRMKAEGRYITTIFDAFGVHANDCDRVREIYADIMVELLHSDILARIVSTIRGTEYIIKKGDLSEADIRNSVYFLG